MQAAPSYVNIDRMTPDYAELLRLLLNLIRFGSIAEVDCSTQRVRVCTGDNLTDWRPWLTLRAGTTQTWCPPTVGEQVILLSPEGDLMQSVVLPAVYSEQHPTPSNNATHHTIHYPDGAVIQYDSAGHQLTAVIPHGSAMVTADQVTSNAPETICTGNLTVQKNLIVNGFSSLNAGLTVQAGSNGAAAVVQGSLQATDDVTANGISLANHQHGGVQSGGSDTGSPK